MDFKNFLQNNVVILDGSMGTLLQSRGLKAGEKPETWNITNPDVIEEVHLSYFNAGSNVVSTNTFGANTLKYGKSELEDIVKNAVRIAKNARDKSTSTAPKFVALDIGPTGKLLSPLGDLSFDEAYEIFKTTVLLGVKYGVDLVFIETMNDSYETKAAVLAVKENSDLPVMVSNAYGVDSTLMTGATPESMVALLEGLGVDALGANCSFGPDKLLPTIERILNVSSIPVLFKPNAGLPKVVDGVTLFDISESQFSDFVKSSIKKGVRLVGGCCGTTPHYISSLKNSLSDTTPLSITKKDLTIVSSYTRAVDFSKPLIVGERINPTGKKRFKEALLQNDIAYVLDEAVVQQEAGADILDVNVGLPGIDEVKMLTTITRELQAVTDLPLQLDTSNPKALESALRYYNGKAMINSVNGKQESLDSVFPLVKKYGGVVVALTLDEDGIPNSVKERFEIAKKILKVAQGYGIDKKDIVFDTLTMAVSADKNAPSITLNAMKKIRSELKCHTTLGVSNVSFGLPSRDTINATFFGLALNMGLSAGIINPKSLEMMKTYHSFMALNGYDQDCTNYVDFATTLTDTIATTVSPNKTEFNTDSPLQNAIIKGLRREIKELTKGLLSSIPPLCIITEHVIPALNIVGKGFEEKTVFLPGLLMSAECAKIAFSEVKAVMGTTNEVQKCTVVLATVKGDVHDIGKNIVKLLLENYGYEVIDLGKDVDSHVIVEKVVSTHAPIIGLSALMTTTVPAMEDTIALIKKEAPWCKVIVGGAVLTPEYATKIGSDYYAKDATDTVKIADKIIKSLKI